MKLVPVSAPEGESLELHAARDADGSAQGEVRRRFGRDAGEKNQVPDDWDGAS